MAVNAPFFLDAADLATATAVYLDLSLTNIAPDGFYGDGTITREQSSGILLTSEPWVSTCPAPCGQPINAGGESGIYQINLDAGSLGTGAIRIMFDPASVPDGIRITYDGVVYNKISSPIYGVMESSNYGHYTIIGKSTSTSACAAWYPSGGTLTQSVYLYNPNSPNVDKFEPTGGTQTNTIVVGDIFTYTERPDDSWLVIPKPNLTPSEVFIEIIGPCTETGWNIILNCPDALPTFASSNVSVNASISCSEGMPNTYYFAKVHKEADTYVGLYDYVFSDENGEFPLANGFYLTSNVAVPNKVIEVDNGVIIAITNCI